MFVYFSLYSFGALLSTVTVFFRPALLNPCMDPRRALLSLVTGGGAVTGPEGGGGGGGGGAPGAPGAGGGGGGTGAGEAAGGGGGGGAGTPAKEKRYY